MRKLDKKPNSASRGKTDSSKTKSNLQSASSFPTHGLEDVARGLEHQTKNLVCPGLISGAWTEFFFLTQQFGSAWAQCQRSGSVKDILTVWDRLHGNGILEYFTFD